MGTAKTTDTAPVKRTLSVAARRKIAAFQRYTVSKPKAVSRSMVIVLLK